MKFRSVEYIIEEAFVGIKRNGLMAFASISTIALTLGVLGAFILAALGANNFAAAQINRFEIAVFAVDDTKPADAEAIAADIRKLPGVESVTTRDRQQEWANLKRDRPDLDPAGLPLNVLPYAMDVKVSAHERMSAIATRIRSMEHVDKVMEGRETYESVMAVAQVVKGISVAGVIVLLITAAFIISNAIKLTLYARRREIRIMQLVGATNQFIRVPLVIEGIVFGAAGAMVAWLLLRIGSGYVSSTAQRIMPLLGQFTSGLSYSQLAVGLTIIGAAIGAVGSLVSIRRFLHDQ